MSDQAAATPEARREELVGVHGWLKWICFCLTILVPRVTLRTLWIFSQRLARPGVADNVRWFLEIYGFLWFLVGCFGFYAGYQLWRVKRGAVTLAKASLVYAFAVLLSQQISLAVHFNRPFSKSTLLQSVINTVVWYWYLERSRRVRNTYFGAQSLMEASESATAPART